MSAASSHRLDGIEPDNLLAFLVLLGLLRALEMSRPEWHARAYWDLHAAPLRPVLTTQPQTSREDICSAALEGLALLKEALWPFSWPRSKEESSRRTGLLSIESRKTVSMKERQNYLAMRCVRAAACCPVGTKEHLIWRLRCDLLSSCGAYIINRKGTRKNDFDGTPLKLPSGQMGFIGAQIELLKKCSTNDIFACLFGIWKYQYKGSSLRLSPEEARRYAYRAADPAPEGSRTELGASALGSLGLVAFTMCPGIPYWNMIAYKGTRTEGRIRYPIWNHSKSRGISRHGLESILASIVFESRRELRQPIWATIIATARRYILDPSQGDYGNISRAQLTHVSGD